MTAKVMTHDCPGSVAPENRTESIADWSIAKGKAVGLVTTTRVTHASPAGAYAHTAHRNWESDVDLAMSGVDVRQCEDIAKQLVTRSPGKDIKVINVILAKLLNFGCTYFKHFPKRTMLI